MSQFIALYNYNSNESERRDHSHESKSHTKRSCAQKNIKNYQNCAICSTRPLWLRLQTLELPQNQRPTLPNHRYLWGTSSSYPQSLLNLESDNPSQPRKRDEILIYKTGVWRGFHAQLHAKWLNSQKIDLWYLVCRLSVTRGLEVNQSNNQKLII